MGLIADSFVIALILKKLRFPFLLLLILPIIAFSSLFAQFCRIAFSTHYKYRYYKISLHRLKTRGYKDQYFECEMHEPCFRIIISDCLKSNGYKTEYSQLKKKCKGKNLRVKNAKIKLLEKVKRQNAVVSKINYTKNPSLRTDKDSEAIYYRNQLKENL